MIKAVILAGGFGTRLSEETTIKPKPMVEIGGKPILLHLMEYFASYGVNEFIICLGYKGDYIKRFFLDYQRSMNSFELDMATGNVRLITEVRQNWKITLLDTGLHTMTGGRIKKVVEDLHLEHDFFMTYGDGLADVDLFSLLKVHRKSKKLCTVTAVSPPGRFGVLDVCNQTGLVTGFREKLISDQHKVNGGFFVLNPRAVKYIESDLQPWEDKPMEKLASDCELNAFQHDGFWKPMDTLRDKNELEKIFESGNAPWVRL
jgi:glucose-1-phosphate cytidylyltransferase